VLIAWHYSALPKFLVEFSVTEVVTYQSAGVNIEAGNTLVKRIKKVSKITRRSEVVSEIGHFGAMCSIPSGYQDPVLVSGTDGVGTKLKLAAEHNQLTGIGVDLVAMSVNDVVVTGAQPLFFLDYYATSLLEVDRAEEVITSIAEGCRIAGCALVGGECAEMPGFYARGMFDLAGFCVGVVERNKIISANKVQPGDQLIGIASSGVHANGFSLVHKLVKDGKLDISGRCDGGANLLQTLLTPTRIYVTSLLALYKEVPVHSVAHVTGGGMPENLPRVLPQGTRARISLYSWELPKVFQHIQRQSHLDHEGMLKVYNCGVGMVVCVPRQYLEQSISILRENGERAWHMGSIEQADADEQPNVVFQGSWSGRGTAE